MHSITIGLVLHLISFNENYMVLKI
jgi:hypothetical protein